MDDVEQQLIRVLGDRAETLEIPHPPIGDLVAGGERAAASRRRIQVRAAAITGVLAAAAVAAIALPIGLAHRDDTAPPAPARSAAATPTPTTAANGFPAPVGTLPQASSAAQWPYTRDGRIVIADGAEAPWDGGPILTTPGAAGATPVTLWTEKGSGEIHTWRDGHDSVFSTDRAAPTASYLSGGGGVLSPDGSTFFVSGAINGTTTEVQAWDTATGRLIAHRDVPSDPSGDPNWPLIGADDRGRLYLSSLAPGPAASRWDPHTGDAVAVTGLVGHLSGVAPGGLTTTIGTRTVFGTVDDTGHWHRVAPLPAGPVEWSGDGTHYLAANPAPDKMPMQPEVVDLATGATYPLPVSTSAFQSGIGFENGPDGAPISALFVADDGPHRYVVRCSLDASNCERVFDMARASGMRLAPGPQT